MSYLDHVEIIAKEEITQPIHWPTTIVGVIVIMLLLSTLIYLFKTKDADKSIRLISKVAICGLCAMFISLFICSFFKHPTGRYKYEATIDKDEMTISEYETFMNDYNHIYQKGEVYYFEDWLK